MESAHCLRNRVAVVRIYHEGPKENMKGHIFKVGDKVRVPKWMAIHKRYNRGVVTYKNGANLLIKLNYKDVICHLYITEATFGWK